MKFILSLLVIAVLFSCEKAELPKPFSAGPSANTVSVTMGSDYSNQLFFNLESGSVVSHNNREIWDLAFQSGENGRMIALNSAKFMAIGKTAETDLNAVNTGTAVDWIYDNQKGMEDSMALYEWELNRVYIVDRGTNLSGTQIGKMKFRVTAFSAASYTIEWGGLAETTFTTSEIEKNNAFNFTFFSFNGGGETVYVEPQKDAWDLCFTSYTYIYPDGMPYLVTGVLSNRNLTKVAEVTASFDEVDYNYATSLSFSDDLDIIGFDWKFYDFDLAVYSVLFDKIYVMKSVQGRFYKLRFLDFYDETGSKGTPSFELQEIVP